MKKSSTSSRLIRIPFRAFPSFERSDAGSFVNYLTRNLGAAGVSVNEGTVKIELDFVDDCIVWRLP